MFPKGKATGDRIEGLLWAANENRLPEYARALSNSENYKESGGYFPNEDSVISYGNYIASAGYSDLRLARDALETLSQGEVLKAEFGKALQIVNDRISYLDDTAGRMVLDVARSGLAVLDTPTAAYRMAVNGEVNWENGLTLAGAIGAPVLKIGGKLLDNSVEIASTSASGLRTLGPGWRVIAPAGEGAATGILPTGYKTVSRWMKPKEAVAWIREGGSGIPRIERSNRMFVTELGAAKPGGTGPIRVDFAVPETALQKAGKVEWFQIFQPTPSRPVYNVQIHVPEGVKIPGY